MGSVVLPWHNTLKWSAILGLSFFAQCCRPRESMLQSSRALREFRTSLSKVLTLWHCVKAKQRYQYVHDIFLKKVPSNHTMHCWQFSSLCLNSGFIFSVGTQKLVLKYCKHGGRTVWNDKNFKPNHSNTREILRIMESSLDVFVSLWRGIFIGGYWHGYCILLYMSYTSTEF